MTRSVFVSQTGLSEPLGRSQIVPYLVGLAHRGHELSVVGFEVEGTDAAAIAAVTAELGAAGIDYAWAPRSRAHGLPTKIWESAGALGRLSAHALRRRPRIVHARSYLPGAVAMALSAMLPGARFVFDCRGLLGDEYVDFGHWRRESLNYRLLKRVERDLFRRADGIVTLTARLAEWLHQENLVDQSTPLEVIPCCVDLQHFQVDLATRQDARSRLGAGDRFVLAYAGSLGAWYCETQMAHLYAALRSKRPSLFAVYTRSPSDKLRNALRASGVPDNELVVQPTAFDAMPAALAAADAAISFAEPRFSKIASSPVKVAEYLACGVPVVLNRGVGDSDALIDELCHPSNDAGAIGVDAGGLSPTELDRAAAALATLTVGAAERARARAAAERHFSLQSVGIARYQRLYQALS